MVFDIREFFFGRNVGGIFLKYCAHPWKERERESRGTLRLPTSANWSARWLPVMSMCAGTWSQRTSCPHTRRIDNSSSHRSPGPTGSLRPTHRWHCALRLHPPPTVSLGRLACACLESCPAAPCAREGRGLGILYCMAPRTKPGVGDVGVDVVPEVAQGGHAVDPRPPFTCHGVGWGGTGRGLGHVGLAVAGAARGGHPLRLKTAMKKTLVMNAPLCLCSFLFPALSASAAAACPCLCAALSASAAVAKLQFPS